MELSGNFSRALVLIGYFPQLALPNQREVIPSWQSRLRLNVLNNLIVIPESGSDVLIEKGVSFSAPLYWQLPQIFLGDKVNTCLNSTEILRLAVKMGSGWRLL